MGETVEVRSVLRLDDKSSHVVEKLKGGYERLSEKVGEVEHEMLGMAKQAAATAAGFELFRGIESIKELGHEFFDAAAGLAEEKKQLATSIAIGDKAGRSYAEIKEQASELHDTLEGLGAEMGVSTEAIVESFSEIQSRSNRSVESTKQLVEEMILAGRAVPGGMEGIAGAFRDLEAGFVRPRNQLVQLMIMTGTVEGSAKKVAKGLNAMFQAGQQDKVIALAEQAIGRMSAKTKDLPPTFGQVITSLKTMRENIFESVGTHLVKSLTPPLQQMRKYLLDNRESMERWAESAGEKVGEWVKEAAEKVQSGFEYLKSHANEIRLAVGEAVDKAKSVVDFIIAHREAIALAFGAKAAMPLVGAVAGGAGQAIGLVKNIAAGGAGSLGIAGGSAVAFATTIAAFAAAVGAWKLAIDQWEKLQGLTHGKSDAEQNEDARKAALERITSTPEKLNTAEFDTLRAKFVEQSDAMGLTARTAGEYVDSLWNMHETIRAQAAQFDEAAGKAEQGADAEGVAEWASAYGRAVEAHSEGLEKYAAKVLAGNETLFNALLASGTQIEGGYDHLAELVQDRSEDYAKVLRGMGGEKGKAPDKVQLNFNNANIHIKQDFRQGDPERVLLAFKRDLVKNSVARTQSRFGLPGGI